MSTTPPVATIGQIAYHFTHLRNPSDGNWGTCMCSRNTPPDPEITIDDEPYCESFWVEDQTKAYGGCKWDIPDTDTYINGVVLTIDGDYWQGHLIEVVEHTSSTVSYMVINTYYGHHPETGEIDSAYTAYPPQCGTFFDRTDAADRGVVAHWAIDTIYANADSYFER